MIKKLQFKITKKGRKWFEGTNDIYTRGVQIEINEHSQHWNVGDIVEFMGRIEKESNRFGTTIKIYPLSEKEALNESLKQLESDYQRWQGYIEEARKRGSLYEAGIEKLKEIAKKIGEEKERETEEYIKQVKQEVSQIKAKIRYKNLISYIENATSYNNFLDNYNELKTLIEKHPELQPQFEKDETLVEKCRQNALVKTIEHMLSNYKNSFSKRNSESEQEEKIKSYISKLTDISLQEKYYVNLQKIINDKEQERAEQERQFREKYEKVFQSLNPYFDDEHIKAIIKYTLRKYPVYNEEYILVDIPQKYRYYITQECHMIVASTKVNIIPEIVNEFDDKDEEVISLKDYLYFVPARKKELFEKIKNIIEHPEMIYNFLSSCDGKVINIEKELPAYWNHLKKQYVAVVTEKMQLDFISHLYNFTSSRYNADMDWKLPNVINTIIVAKDGSHKHMFHTFYKLTEEGWKNIYCIEAYEWNDVIWEIIKDMISE